MRRRRCPPPCASSLPKVFSDLKTAEYGASGHPEAPFRVSKTFERLKAAGLAPEKPPVQATRADVERLHAPEHFEAVYAGKWADADTPVYPGIAEIAMISLSGALSAAACAAKGDPAFSLMRPPGHHAGKKRVSGFCFFNNVPLAVARYQAENPGKRVAIIDVDVHHGDGTQELVAGRAGILFCSLHQIPLYPGTGVHSDENCLNFGLPPETGEARYLETLEQALCHAESFKPDLLAVSAGFDTYKEDPIAHMKLEKATYKRMGHMLASLKTPRFAALEGGYAEELPKLVENFLEGFFG